MKEKTFILILVLLVLFLVLFSGSLGYWYIFGSNAAARRWGGTQVVKIEPAHKVVNVTWKDKSLWVLTRPMRADEKPETFTFAEKSNLGIMEGAVLLEEQAVK